MTVSPPVTDHPQQSAAALDAHVRDIVRWHFSPETGTPYWLSYAERAGWDPLREIEGFADLGRFECFDDDAMRDLPHAAWIPRAYAGRPYCIFETGGTTGRPKQRLSWEDHLTD